MPSIGEQKVIIKIRDLKRKLKENDSSSDFISIIANKNIFREKAIRSVKNACELSSIFLITSCIVVPMFGQISEVLNTGNANIPVLLSSIALLFAISLPAIILTLKTARLEVTPSFALVTLLFALFTNLLLFSGILPLIAAVLCIIALVRWPTYHDWFYDVAKEPKPYGRQTILSVALVIMTVATVVCSVAFFFAGVQSGQQSGVEAGYYAGYEYGQQTADSAHQSDYTNGYNNGYKSGYTDGHLDGLRCAAFGWNC